jgi:hypothetical protein
MMLRLSRQRWIWPAVLLSLLAMVIAQTAQAQGTTVRLETPPDTPIAGRESFDVTAVVDNVTNLGAFQFQLTYDSHVIELQDVKEGPFLGSSGRPVQCLPPRRTEGSIDFTCVTLGATPDGPAGSGVLAILTFQPVGAGTSPLHFEQLILTDPPANRLPSEMEDTSLIVEQAPGGGFSWVLWGPVIGCVGLALAAAAVGTWRLRHRPGQP